MCVQEGLTENQENLEESRQKKFKSNPCIICLGLLEDSSVNEILSSPDLQKVKEYDCDAFTCSISMPACIYLRERSVRLLLEEKFPKFFTDGIYCTIIMLYNVFIRFSLQIKKIYK